MILQYKSSEIKFVSELDNKNTNLNTFINNQAYWLKVTRQSIIVKHLPYKTVTNKYNKIIYYYYPPYLEIGSCGSVVLATEKNGV